MLSVPGSMVSLLVNNAVRFATCWSITRVDNTVFRFTDHDRNLTVDGAVYYSSKGGLSASARQVREGLETQNLEVRGAVSSDAILFDDLRAGKFKNAKVREFTVDWRYPSAGKFWESTYTLDTTEFSSEVWMANIIGIFARMKARVGDICQRTCRWKAFGDTNCGKNLASVTTTGSVVSVIDNRLQFTTNLAGVTNLYTDGKITWTSGNNNGVVSEVHTHLTTGGNILLHLRTPYIIQAGDNFTAVQGCRRTYDDCIRHGQQVRFGGFLDIPGNDVLYETPDTVKS